MTNVLGKVVQWNDAKGFGFIQPHDGAGRQFFHASDFDDGDNGRPRVGDWVRFAPGQDEKGRACAKTVRPAVARRSPTAMRTRRRRRAGRLLPLLGWIFLLAWAVGAAHLMHAGRLPAAAAAAIGMLSLVTWMAYALDKHAAERRRQRIPERILHALELLGGWPAGFLAQRVLNHKRRKRRYQVVFWTCAVLNTATWWAWTQGLLALA
ncbi:MAG: cold shock and DUF1294 domain-containing protein [Pseudoxanthomonas sp.]